MTPFLEKVPDLQELKLSYCEGISEAEMVKVPLMLPKLKILDIHGCDQISDETITDMKAKYPHLNLIE